MPNFPNLPSEAPEDMHEWEAHIADLRRHADAQPRIMLANHQQLARIATHHHAGDDLTELQARELYQRYWQQLDWGTMARAERDLFGWLWVKYGDVVSPLDAGPRLPCIEDPPEEWVPLTPEQAAHIDELTARFNARLEQLRQQESKSRGSTDPGDEQ